LYQAHQNVVQLAINDFLKMNDPRAQQLKSLLSQSSRLFDQPIREALEISLQDPMLFDHYWQCEKMKSIFFEVITVPSAGFDVQAFFAILEEISQRKSQFHPQNIDTRIVFGALDPVVSKKNENIYCRKYFPQSKIIEIPEARHWPHLE